MDSVPVPYVPPRATRGEVLVDYWEKSNAWTGDGHAPFLLEAETRMPEWGDGLLPFGRSLPAVGQAAWLTVGAQGGAYREGAVEPADGGEGQAAPEE